MVKKEGSFLQILLVLFILLILIKISSGFAFAQTVILNQPPTQEDAWVSDPDYPHSIAENFILSSTTTVTQIKIWGIYCCSSNTPGTDNFTVIFHSDSGGLPSGVISTQNNVPVTRQATGGTIYSAWTEYVYTLTLATPVNLIPGTYWVEIYNDVTVSSDRFYWELGTVDPVNGIPGSAESSSVPGSSWASSNTDNLAIEITASTPTSAIPTMNEWGMIVFTILAGFGAVVYLRRQSRATR